MDRVILREHLALAERHASEGRQRITEQARDGHDTTGARKVLATLRDTQALHEEDVKRTLKELEH
jgi:hypothetical protein